MASTDKTYTIKYIGKEYQIAAKNSALAVFALIKKLYTNVAEVHVYEADNRNFNCVVMNEIRPHYHHVFYYTISFTTRENFAGSIQ